MTDNEHKPDPSVNAARIVGEATAEAGATADDVDAAWAEWSSHLQNVDERTMTLLRAAYEAGFEANGKHTGAAELGRLGGKKGGRARADKLSAARKSEIAKKAADVRWKKTESRR
jgi:hypothetical protein